MPLQDYEMVDFPLVKMKGERRIIPQYLEAVPVRRGPLKDIRVWSRGSRGREYTTWETRNHATPGGRPSAGEKARSLLEEGLDRVCPPLDREDALSAVASESGVPANTLRVFLRNGIPLRLRDLVLVEGLAPVVERFSRKQRGLPPVWNGNYVKILRQKRNLSHAQLASRLYLVPGTIHRWEKNGDFVERRHWDLLDSMWLGWWDARYARSL